MEPFHFTRSAFFVFLLEYMFRWETAHAPARFTAENNKLEWCGCKEAAINNGIEKMGLAYPDIKLAIVGKTMSAALFSWLCQLYRAEYLPQWHGGLYSYLGRELTRTFHVYKLPNHEFLQESLEVVAVDVQRRKIVFKAATEQIQQEAAPGMRQTFRHLGYDIKFAE